MPIGLEPCHTKIDVYDNAMQNKFIDEMSNNVAQIKFDENL